MKFEKNIGILDMVLRIGISAGIIYVGFIDLTIIPDEFSSMVIGTIGVLNLISALFRYCPFYALTGINTCKLE
ncbi:hypothetical protein MNBD_GAMMA15-2102 [hydrothermal vent metagenome]|uniref:Inner membrane protein YgaP-like transmembrane domain-containing protein n=1 Tax=hydrothermal vent metagenome TaxID=652676 RepID=A0A3B0Y5J3_9ZZZZ